MQSTEDDLGLVAACRAGRWEAFGILVERYQDRLYPTLLRLTGCSEDARDLLQDAFLRAFEKLSWFHGESSFYTWVYRIAVNLAISDRRKRFGGPRLARPLGGEVREPSGDPVETDPAHPLEQAERDEMIQKALDALQPDHRAVVVMKDLDGLRYEEIAAILDVPRRNRPKSFAPRTLRTKRASSGGSGRHAPARSRSRLDRANSSEVIRSEGSSESNQVTGTDGRSKPSSSRNI